MISPSLQREVKTHIFFKAIEFNTIFQGDLHILDFVVNDIDTLLYLPEDDIILQGTNGASIYFIARGDCEILVKDHRKKNTVVNRI